MIRRREFLGSLGVASIAASLPLTAGEKTALNMPLPDKAWDVSWVDRITGKNRAVFDSPEFSEGAALFRAVIWKRQYKEVYGTAAQEMSAVLVVRHEGIALAMKDEFWTKFEIGKRKKFKDSEKNRFYEHNPIAAAPPGAPPQAAEMNIPRFIADGGIMLACNLAFADMIAIVKKENKLNDVDAEAMAQSFLLPGVILQPSGVFAALRAQEAGCHYLLAS